MNKIFYLEYTSMTKLSSSLNYPIHMRTGGYILQNKYGFRLEKYSHILVWCGRMFIKGRTCNRKECSFTKLVYPFNNEMIWFVILMHQKSFLSLKISLFQVYGNIEIVEGYSSQTYSGGCSVLVLLFWIYFYKQCTHLVPPKKRGEETPMVNHVMWRI